MEDHRSNSFTFPGSLRPPARPSRMVKGSGVGASESRTAPVDRAPGRCDRWLATVLGLLLLGGGLARAETPDASLFDETDVRITGFGTLAATYGGDDRLRVRRDISRPGAPDRRWSLAPDSLFGVQLDARFGDTLGAAVQLVGKDRADDSFGESVEWAYARYNLSPETTVRAGRMGFDVFMLSEYRNIGFAYLWARPPVEFYGPLAFDSFDGMDLSHSVPVGSGVLRVKLSGGVADNDFVVRSGSEPTHVEMSPFLSFTLDWENNDYRLQLGLAKMELDEPIATVEPLSNALKQASAFWPQAAAIAADLESEGRSFHYYTAGFAYNGHPWRLQAEVSAIESNYKVFPTLVGAYGSLGYKVDDVTLYAMGAVARTQGGRRLVSPAPPVPALQGLQAAAQNLFDLSPVDQKTLSLGARWDLRHDMAVKLQWDHSWVGAYGGTLMFQPNVLSTDHEVDTFTLGLDFVF